MTAPLADDLPAALRAEVERGYGKTLGASVRLVDVGDECDIWRVQTTRGTIAVRVSPGARSEAGLNWSHRLLAYVASRVPEAVAPLATTDGKTLVRWEGRLVSVYPWVDGEAATIELPFICAAAARLLARLHHAMRGWGEPPPLRLSLAGGEAGLVDDDLDRLLIKIEPSRDLLRGPVHGDYYPRNLICQDKRIVGVIDWDESHADLLAQELAWAVWEFGQDASRADLDLERARNFVAAYADEGGPVPASEQRLIIPLIRKRLREEVDQAAGWVARGAAIDQDYMDREIAAFHKLRDVDIEW
jgi:Ser/Thr protein kinase RdoA (MazF antagonist)